MSAIWRENQRADWIFTGLLGNMRENLPRGAYPSDAQMGNAADRVMSESSHYLELRCPACAWRETCGSQGVTAWLRRMGKLRTAHEPEPEILYEVFRATVPQMTCPGCGKQGLYWTPVEDGWDDPPCCTMCARPISPQRLAAVPGTTLCAACQGDLEQGRSPRSDEFCPRCGAAMALRLSRRAGVARYVMACTAQPPCRLG
jgi:hypothetical protein